MTWWFKGRPMPTDPNPHPWPLSRPLPPSRTGRGEPSAPNNPGGVSPSSPGEGGWEGTGEEGRGDEGSGGRGYRKARERSPHPSPATLGPPIRRRPRGPRRPSRRGLERGRGGAPAGDRGADTMPVETPLAERTGMLFRGTPVVRGSGEGVVVATGMATELGRIAALAEASGGEQTPLEDRLERLGRTLGLVTMGIAALTTITGVLAGRGLFLMIETGIALAVAAVPEGLPIVATLALARGVWRMARRNALVNRLSSVETLGAVTLVATDKTGTLTENRMTLTRLAVEEGDLPPESGAPEARRALEIALLCNNADAAAGDPMERALLAAGERAGLDRAELLRRFPREREEAFDPATQMMATFHRIPEGGFRVAVKGAPERVLAACDLADEERRRWLGRNQELAGQGFRILGLAERTAVAVDESPYADL